MLVLNLAATPNNQPTDPARSERLARAERELAAAQGELAAVEARSADLSGQEERYWHSLNEFQLRLQEHMDERDALAHRCGACSVAGAQRTPAGCL